MAVACRQPCFTVADSGDRAIAIKLDLVQPAIFGWRLRREGGELRFGRIGQVGLLRALDLRGLGFGFRVARQGRWRRAIFQFLHGQARHHTFGRVLGNDPLGLGPRVDVAFFDQQPLFAGRAGAFDAHQRPAALHLLAVESKLHVAAFVVGIGVVGHRHPRAGVPHNHRTPAVLPLRDRALKAAIADGMIFGAHRQAFDLGVEAGSARHRPAFQHAAHFKAEVVMQSACVVHLHHEHVAADAGRGFNRFGRNAKVAFGPVFIKIGDAAGRGRLFGR